MSSETFTVDTHLFRELGELLVGRDSTALVELIKNSYDADAEEVIVHGESLDDPARGTIVVQDDGVGMNAGQFREGFLRIASRLKEGADRRSPIYKRRFTGAKGIGRLAAHKLAKKLEIYSVPSTQTRQSDLNPVTASIDWKLVEQFETLDQIVNSRAVLVTSAMRPARAEQGTRIELKNLRRKWTSAERLRFFTEVQTFEPPKQLLHIDPSLLTNGKEQKRALLFARPIVKESSENDPGFEVKLTGDFEAGEDYWQSLAETAQWILEIDARQELKKVKVNLLPTRAGKNEVPDATQSQFSLPHPDNTNGPFFQARILIREFGGGDPVEQRWRGRSCGVRVFMEGFRVLPYGAPDDDWLSLDADYKKRPRTLPFLAESGIQGEPADPDEGLVFLANSNYFGAVFLTTKSAPTLRMLVNREGFEPSPETENLVKLLRQAIYLSVRVRAAFTLQRRQQRRIERSEVSTGGAVERVTSRMNLRRAVNVTVARATELAREARKYAAEGNITLAQQRIQEAAASFTEGAETHERLMTEGAMLRILASVGTQMSSFVHEINGLLGTASAVEAAVDRILKNTELPESGRKELSRIALAIGDLRRSVERQASYLTDVVSADARRRRSRQKLSERFDAAARIIQTSADRRGIRIENLLPVELRSPPMFPAEVAVVFSNLLSNAVKAAGRNGRIRPTGKQPADKGALIKVENTGRRVDPRKGERWFRPFESTTVRTTDPVLGQGMGMGLTLTRNLLEEYGATIQFTYPSRGFETALEIQFPSA